MGCKMVHGGVDEESRTLRLHRVVVRDRPTDVEPVVLADRVVMACVFAAFAFVVLGLLQGWL
jgi:hypothetical protein